MEVKEKKKKKIILKMKDRDDELLKSVITYELITTGKIINGQEIDWKSISENDINWENILINFINNYTSAGDIDGKPINTGDITPDKLKQRYKGYIQMKPANLTAEDIKLIVKLAEDEQYQKQGKTSWKKLQETCFPNISPNVLKNIVNTQKRHDLNPNIKCRQRKYLIPDQK